LDTFIKGENDSRVLRTLNSAKKFPNEKEYVFLQEFIPNNGNDLKIDVVGDKLSFIDEK
jgi:glutathione synthase/RimK-type ligase-like ATP-grasp enzyme